MLDEICVNNFLSTSPLSNPPNPNNHYHYRQSLSAVAFKLAVTSLISLSSKSWKWRRTESHPKYHQCRYASGRGHRTHSNRCHSCRICFVSSFNVPLQYIQSPAAQNFLIQRNKTFRISSTKSKVNVIFQTIREHGEDILQKINERRHFDQQIMSCSNQLGQGQGGPKNLSIKVNTISHFVIIGNIHLQRLQHCRRGVGSDQYFFLILEKFLF